MGSAIDISANGNTIALGARFRNISDFEGAVEVYDWNGNAWAHRGPELVGDGSFSRFGTRVSLSADGNRVAVDAPTNMPNRFVRVYDWDGLAWVPLGEDIFGDISSFELSSDGMRLVVGIPGSSSSFPNAGEVLTYDWNGTTWAQVGQAILGESSGESIGNTLSLSGDGNTLALYTVGNTNEGIIRTYQWDGTDWVNLGQSLMGMTGERLGRSLSLTENGLRLAAGSFALNPDGSNPGKVFVYQWDGTIWQPVGLELQGLVDQDDFGASICLSGDGSKLVVGSRENDLNGRGSGLMQVFELIGGQWVLIGGNILGDDPEIVDELIQDDGLGRKVAISTNGTRVVGGSDGFGNLDGLILGYVKAYSLEASSISCFAEDEVEVKSCDECERVNYALGKPTQTPCDYGFSTSDLGVDGITEGDNPWGIPDIVHTCVPYTDPWWQVDLQKEFAISEICLYNRNSKIESILERLSNYYLFVSSQPFDEKASLEQLLADRTIYHTFVEEVAEYPSCIEIPELNGRYIRVQVPGDRILNFAELEVYGCKKTACSSSENLALNQEATQSSTYGFGIASIAVDGDKDGSRGPWANPSIQHTQREEQPWWQVNLGKITPIDEVSIFNRTDCCMQRLEDFYVFVSPNPIDGSLSAEELAADPSISHRFVSGVAQAKETLFFTKELGQYVMVKLSKMGILHMAEVEVRGCEGDIPTVANRFAKVDAAPQRGSVLSMNAFPNPFAESFTLEIEGELAEGSQLEILNALGQVVERQALRQKITEIQSKNLPQGIYVVQVKNGDRMHEVKVVKMR